MVRISIATSYRAIAIVAGLLAVSCLFLWWLPGHLTMSRLTSDDTAVRRKTIASLDGASLHKAITRLISHLRHGGRDQERAVRALSEIAGPAENPLILALEKPYELYCFWLRDGDDAMKCGAVKALGVIKDPKTIEPMLSCLRFETAERMAHDQWGRHSHSRYDAFAAAIHESIEAMGDAGVREMLDQSRRQGRVSAQYAALLVDLGKKGFIRPTVEALRDSILSRDAALILARIGSRDTIDALAEALSSHIPEKRYDVAFALASMDDDKVASALGEFELRNKEEIDSGRSGYQAILAEKGPLTNEKTDFCRFLLARYGTQDMAGDFIKASARPDLQREARQWLASHSAAAQVQTPTSLGGMQIGPQPTFDATAGS